MGVESLMCFVALGYTYLLPVIGLWLLFSFALSLVGVSIAVCCCPTVGGWRKAYWCSGIAYAIRVLLLAACTLLLSASNNNSVRTAAIVCKCV